MTIEINQDQRSRAAETPTAGPTAKPRPFLIVGLAIGGAVVATAGFVLLGLDLANPTTHFGLYAVACLVIAALAGVVVCVHRLLADRQEFYRRGQLDGWYRGFRMQEPETGDPLLK